MDVRIRHKLAFVLMFSFGTLFSACEGAVSKEIVGGNDKTEETPVPSAPLDLMVLAASASQLNLTWNDTSDNETGFRIERKPEGGSYTELVTLPADSQSHSDLGLDPATAYYYRVQAFNPAGVSAYSKEVSAVTFDAPVEPPAAPSAMTAVAVSHTQIDLTWKDNADNEESFVVERKLGAAGTYAPHVTLGANTQTYSDTGLHAQTQYFYRVVAANAAGESVASNEAAATTGIPPKPAYGSMVTIPAGCFQMGDAFGEGQSYELPVHNVCLSEFEMDAFEVTNAQYQSCVTGGGCTAPTLASSSLRSPYATAITYANYPAIRVSWNQAQAFCSWANKRLPTEAEWEYAARGGLEGKRFPWGDTIECSRANYRTSDEFAYDIDLQPTKVCVEVDMGLGDTVEVGSYAPNGYGLYDMAGNVMEWVADWSKTDYYTGRPDPDYDPTGPTTGLFKTTRGGAFNDKAFQLRVAVRAPAYDVDDSHTNVGFRCAR